VGCFGGHGLLSHYSLESLRKSLLKAAAEIPLEMECVATAEWPEGIKDCVEA